MEDRVLGVANRMQVATRLPASPPRCGLTGAELMFARPDVNGRQRTRSPLIYFPPCAAVKTDAPSLPDDISRDVPPPPPGPRLSAFDVDCIAWR